jgi:hypothetical protein
MLTNAWGACNVGEAAMPRLQPLSQQRLQLRDLALPAQWQLIASLPRGTQRGLHRQYLRAHGDMSDSCTAAP